MQKEGYKGLTGLGRQKTLQKIWSKTTKNPQWSLAKSERERGKFEKVSLKQSNLSFKKKLDPRVSIDRKTASIDRNRQRLNKTILKNFD